MDTPTGSSTVYVHGFGTDDSYGHDAYAGGHQAYGYGHIDPYLNHKQGDNVLQITFISIMSFLPPGYGYTKPGYGYNSLYGHSAPHHGLGHPGQLLGSHLAHAGVAHHGVGVPPHGVPHHGVAHHGAAHHLPAGYGAGYGAPQPFVGSGFR